MSITSALKDLKDIPLMMVNTRLNRLRMARPKQFHDRTTLAFPPGTFEAVAALTAPNEDRSDFIRSATEWEITLRQSPAYAELKKLLLANESIHEFCLRAISRAVAQRKAALAGEAQTQPSRENDQG